MVTSKDKKLFTQVAEKLFEVNTVYIYPHINMDGDCLGSSVAMCRALRALGKTVYVLIEDDVPGNLLFLDPDYAKLSGETINICKGDKNHIPFICRDWENLPPADVSLALDCGDDKRFPMRAEKFAEGKFKICVDHHGTTEARHDINLIQPMAGANCCHVFHIIEELQRLADAAGKRVKLIGNHDIGYAIYAGVTTDTGKFQYSNTDEDCHKIMSAIYSWGVKTYPASVQIYESESLSKMKICNMAMSTMKIIAGGKGVVAYVTKEMLEETGAGAGDTDGVAGDLRSIKGIEMAAFLKEKEEGLIRVSLRAKEFGDVAKIGLKYDGGGHKKAAGCTLYDMSIKDACAMMEKELIDGIAELEKEK